MIIKNTCVFIMTAFLSATPIMALNNLVCPTVTYQDIKNINADGELFTVTGANGLQMRFALVGFAALPNWSNPITKINWAPTLESTEFENSAILKCHYSYKTLIGRKYSFSIQAVPDEKVLISIAAFGKTLDTPFKGLKKVYRTRSLQAHPDKGGSVQVMQDLNNQWDDIKAHFGD